MNNTQLSFFQLFEEDNSKIVIPMIQRDYAQGRKQEEEIRNSFLDSLYSYLTGDKTKNNLDFIYAKLIDGEFIPLDGQQRLTTLFLLHWYLAIKDNHYESFKEHLLTDDNTSRFTYEIRTSSTDFCNALVLNGDQLSNQKNSSIKDKIDNAKWFHTSWYHDPTVNSMINMLVAIEKKFMDYNETVLFSKLVDKTNPAITFHFLNLDAKDSSDCFCQNESINSKDEYKLNDDLYIKMNARGKPLSLAEQFKGKIEKKLLSIIKNYSCDNSYTKKQVIDLYLSFSKNIDTIWVNLFWSLIDEENLHEKVKKVDTYLLAIYREFIIFTLLNRIQSSKDEGNISIAKVFITNNNISTFFSSINYSDNLFLEFIEYMIKTFTIITNDQSKFDTLFCNDFFYFNEKKQFVDMLETPLTLKQRVYIYAYFSYRNKHPQEKKYIKNWMRVVRNLLEATTGFNNANESINAAINLKGILKKVGEFPSNIYECLATDKNFSTEGLSNTQFTEERIKARLILQNGSVNWESKINKVEKHPYFKGQISALLNFSGIENQLITNNFLKLENETKSEENWNRYWEILSSMFDEHGLTSEYDKEHILQRALLTKGNDQERDYLLPISQGYSFLENADRDVSWRRFLFADNSFNQDSIYRVIKRGFFKELISDEDFNLTDIKNSLQSIINKAPKRQDFSQYFIDTPKLLDFRNSTTRLRISCEPNKHIVYYILQKTIMSGYYKELYSFLLYIRLQELESDPFINYKENHSYYKPWIEFNDNQSNIMKVSYDNNNHDLLWECPEELTPSLIEYKKKADNIWLDIVAEYGVPEKCDLE